MSKDPVEAAYDTLLKVFLRIKNAAVHESNRHPVGDPQRVEPEISALDRAHIDIERANFDKELVDKLVQTLKKASESSDKLGNKVFWLSVTMVLLTIVIAVAAILELKQ